VFEVALQSAPVPVPEPEEEVAAKEAPAGGAPVTAEAIKH
jgi:hypothetical protein